MVPSTTKLSTVGEREEKAKKGQNHQIKLKKTKNKTKQNKTKNKKT